MKELYERYNVDDIFNRSVIAGLLNLLNNNVKYEQIWDNNVVELVSVPAAFETANADNERFLQDNYTFFGQSCFGGNKIDGKFDMLPRILLKYSGSSIDANNITNRFVKGNYLRNENGKLTSYVAFLYSIPITMSFECEVFFDTIGTGFKIEQAIRETFYKNRTYNVLYRGMKIGCRVGFPEQHTMEQTMSFSFDAERRHKMNFNLSVECYQPCFDDSQSIESSKRIEYIGVDYSHYNTAIGPADRRVRIKMDSATLHPGLKLPSDSHYEIIWDSSCNVSDTCTVSLSYIKDGVEHQIATPLYNQGRYLWYIPEHISNYKQPDIAYITIDRSKIISPPSIKIIPNDNMEFDKDSFIIVNPGFFTNVGNSLPFVLEYTDDDGNFISSDFDNPYKFILRNHKIIGVLCPDKLFKYGKKLKPAEISVKLTYSIDRTIFDKIDNILIF